MLGRKSLGRITSYTYGDKAVGFLQKFLEQFAVLFTKSVPTVATSTDSEVEAEPLPAPLVTTDFFLTEEQLRRCVIASKPSLKVNAQLIAQSMQAACVKFGITTKLQVAHLLAQLSHESGGFSRTTESLIYTPQRLIEVFGHRVFWGQAQELAGDEYATGEAVYGMRADLGNVNAGDGFLFRGHFFIQLTGRANHSKCAAYFGVSIEELLQKVDDLDWNCAVSCWYCTEFRRGFKIAADTNNLIQSTQTVNGGQQGLQDRQLRLSSILKVMESF